MQQVVIISSESPCTSHVVFVKNKDGLTRFHINYQMLNTDAITTGIRFPTTEWAKTINKALQQDIIQTVV